MYRFPGTSPILELLTTPTPQYHIDIGGARSMESDACEQRPFEREWSSGVVDRNNWTATLPPQMKLPMVPGARKYSWASVVRNDCLPLSVNKPQHHTCARHVNNDRHIPQNDRHMDNIEYPYEYIFLSTSK